MTAGRALAIAGAVAAAVAVGAGLWVIGPPEAQRVLRLDERRVRDVDEIVNAVRGYHELERTLPRDLATLSSRPGSTVPTRDPETGAPYEYVVVAPDRFRVCAVFATDTAEQRRAHGRDHGRGRQCFDERIDDDDD